MSAVALQHRTTGMFGVEDESGHSYLRRDKCCCQQNRIFSETYDVNWREHDQECHNRVNAVVEIRIQLS